MPSVILASEPVRKGYFELNRRGVRIRWITDITKENASSCKEIMKIAELRHLDGVKGGFVVADEKVYVASNTQDEKASDPAYLQQCQGNCRTAAIHV